MAWHNVQVTVEVMVEADSPEEAKGKAHAMLGTAIFEALKGMWYCITKVVVVHTREE